MFSFGRNGRRRGRRRIAGEKGGSSSLGFNAVLIMTAEELTEVGEAKEDGDDTGVKKEEEEEEEKKQLP